MDLECLKVLFLTFCIPTLDTEKVKWLLGGKKKLTSKMVFLGQIKCYIMLLIRHFEAMLALCNITQLQKSNAMS